MESEKIVSARESICKPVADLLKGFSDAPFESVESAILLALLATKGEDGASEDEMLKAINWVKRLHMDTTLLLFLLSGAIEIDFSGDEKQVRARNGSGPDMLEALIAAGIAKPVQEA